MASAYQFGQRVAERHHPVLPLNRPEISVVIPAFNEELRIGPTIRGVLAELGTLPLTIEVVVVDDGSTDGTALAANAIAATDTRLRVLHHERNRGLGASYFTGVSASAGVYVSWLPGDDAILPACLATMIALREQADIVITYPVFDGPRPRLRTLLSGVYVGLMNAICGGRVRYFNCVTLMRRDLLLSVLSDRNRGFGIFAEILVRLLRAGCSFVEIPIPSRHQAMAGSKAFRWRNVASVCGQTIRLWWTVRIMAGPRTSHLSLRQR